MPFDGKRMIYGGFKPIVEESAGGKMGYADGYLVAVPTANMQAYRDMAARAAAVIRSMARRASSRRGAMMCPTSHRFQRCGEGHQGRERRLFVGGVAFKRDARQSVAQDNGRRENEAGSRKHAVRWQAHDLRRLRTDSRPVVGKPALRAGFFGRFRFGNAR